MYTSYCNRRGRSLFRIDDRQVVPIKSCAHHREHSGTGSASRNFSFIMPGYKKGYWDGYVQKLTSANHFPKNTYWDLAGCVKNQVSSQYFY